MIGFAICGSFCSHEASLGVLKKLRKKYEILPIMSETAYYTDTRFGRAADLIADVEKITSRNTVHTLEEAEPLGPKNPLDCLLICPCTGNTLAKIAHGVTDTTVTMAAKAHLRNERPLIISLASNDAMGANLQNIATLLNRKNVYFVPMIQDDIEKKPNSLVADFTKVGDTMALALQGRQIRPLFLEKV